MTEEKDKKIGEKDERAFDSNPYAPGNIRPEDVVRIFYTHDVPIIPVISKRGILLGILKKEDVIAELSDIERASHQKIDEFITRLSRKMSLDQLLVYGKIREFVVINIFGEIQDTWSRIRLFASCEEAPEKSSPEQDLNSHKEEQILEWMIYLLLEHIPRPIYAINDRGKTFFFNSYFEDLYARHHEGEVDSVFVEKTLSDPDKNELIQDSNKGGEFVFYNLDLQMYYEKVPMKNHGETVGYMIFCDTRDSEPGGISFIGIDTEKMSLDEVLLAVERQVLVDALRKTGEEKEASKRLGLKPSKLKALIKKHYIDIN